MSLAPTLDAVDDCARGVGIVVERRSASRDILRGLSFDQSFALKPIDRSAFIAASLAHDEVEDTTAFVGFLVVERARIEVYLQAAIRPPPERFGVAHRSVRLAEQAQRYRLHQRREVDRLCTRHQHASTIGRPCRRARNRARRRARGIVGHTRPMPSLRIVAWTPTAKPGRSRRRTIAMQLPMVAQPMPRRLIVSTVTPHHPRVAAPGREGRPANAAEAGSWAADVPALRAPAAGACAQDAQRC